jgi:hypothetical protein
VGTPIGLDVNEKEFAALGDGNFVYELRFLPVIDVEVRNILSTARDNDDHAIALELTRSGKIPDRDLVQTGYFTVQDGTLMSPDLEEGTDTGVTTETRSKEQGVSRSRARVGGAAEESPGEGDATIDPTAKDQVILDDFIIDGSLCVGFDCVNGESFGFDTIRLKENNIRIKFQDTSNSASFPDRDWQITANASANGGANKFSIDDIEGGRTPFTIEADAPSNALYVDDGGRLGLGTSVPVVDLHPVSGNTPTLRLEQNGSSGFTPQTWDVAGNEAGFFIRDATNGSALPFRIQPASQGESLFIKPTGVQVNVAFSAVSDVNMKTRLTPVDPTDTLQKVVELPVNTWSFQSDPSGSTHLGPNSQEFHHAFKLGSDERHIAPLDAAGVALAAIQGLNSRLLATDDALQRNHDSLAAENAKLAARLAEIEKQNEELVDRIAQLEGLLPATSGAQRTEP